MSKRFTIKDIQQSSAGHLNQHLFDDVLPRKINIKKRSKEKDWIGWNITYWCNENAVTMKEEYRFDDKRKYRFDYCIPSLMIGVEYEGLISEKSRHTTIKGYTGDLDKYNLAVSLGWKVLRFTALNYKSLITELNKHI